MSELIDMHGQAHRRELYELGATVNWATGDPKKLKSLLKDPKPRVKATGMIAIPKRNRG
jgi:hypothetical protein